MLLGFHRMHTQSLPANSHICLLCNRHMLSSLADLQIFLEDTHCMFRLGNQNILHCKCMNAKFPLL